MPPLPPHAAARFRQILSANAQPPRLRPLTAALWSLTLCAAPLAMAMPAATNAPQGTPAGNSKPAVQSLISPPSNKEAADTQARFQKGVALLQAGKLTEAAALFSQLTEDHPELPEPYNNLAVIYAQQKQYDKAREALEMAIRTHPAYATALENLGDIYARMASDAYNKALQVNSANAGAQLKLTTLKKIIAPEEAAAVAAQSAAAARAAAAEQARKIAIAEEARRQAAAEQAAREARAKQQAETERAAQSAQSTETTSAIKAALDNWIAAWASKNVSVYLAHYAPDFAPPDGVARSQWAAERKARINKPTPIEVRYEDLRIRMEGNEAVVKFRQHYVSGALRVNSSKTLLMSRQQGQWLIRKESTGAGGN